MTIKYYNFSATSLVFCVQGLSTHYIGIGLVKTENIRLTIYIKTYIDIVS